jgi:hypothetical protein
MILKLGMTISYDVRYTGRCNRGHISEVIPFCLLAIAAFSAFYTGRTVRNVSIFNLPNFLPHFCMLHIILALLYGFT